MIREAVELVESKTPSILKYIPKKLGKKYTTAKVEAEAMLEKLDKSKEINLC